jgi:signal transduction histidine kinase
MSTLLPLSQNGADSCGFIVVGRKLESSITIHSKLPTEEDLPFFTLLQGHIQAAIGNAVSHHRQRDFARLLEERVEQKTKELKEAQSLLMETSRTAGISEIATNILHNVGNVLNSVTISSSQIEGHLSQMHFDSLEKCSELLSQDEKVDTKDFATLLFELHKQFVSTRALALKENRWLCENIEHIKQIVSAQQDLAKTHDILEPCSIEKLINDAVQIVQTNGVDCRISPQIRLEGISIFWIDRHRALQILVNLIRNAIESIKASGKADYSLAINVAVESNATCVVRVTDNGVGIPSDLITRIFSPGFTTKHDGHGFGLHSSANAATEMGGRLYATSEGVGCGATFILEIPYTIKEATR